jgi:hypothetical protein
MFRISVAVARAIMVCEVSFYVMEKLEGTMVILQATLMHTERNFLHSLYNAEFLFKMNLFS